MKSYGKILAIGDPYLKNELFDGEVIVEEKVDGSQFRFGVEDGIPFFGSKGVLYDDEHPPDQMFAKAMETAQAIVQKIGTTQNWFWVCEFLRAPKHNTLTYARVPAQHLVVLDIWIEGTWVHATGKASIAKEHGLECVPVLYRGLVKSADEFKAFLDQESFLGGTKIEGVVVKNHAKQMVFAGKAQSVMGKFVREEFKEMNDKEWGVGKPLEEQIAEGFPKQPRWDKAIQHCRDAGTLTNTPKDFAVLIPELVKDIEEEVAPAAKEKLWKHFKTSVVAEMKNGFIDYYKTKLVEGAFK